MYGSKIIDIKFHVYGGDAAPHKRIISSDTHIVKVGLEALEAARPGSRKGRGGGVGP